MGIYPHFQTYGKAASPPELPGEHVVILSPREKLLLRRFAYEKSVLGQFDCGGLTVGGKLSLVMPYYRA
jgi:hypothetical protein